MHSMIMLVTERGEAIARGSFRGGGGPEAPPTQLAISIILLTGVLLLSLRELPNQVSEWVTS